MMDASAAGISTRTRGARLPHSAILSRGKAARFIASLGLQILLWLLPCSLALAGNQNYEPLSASVQAAMSKAISDRASPEPVFASPIEARSWLADMSQRLAQRMPDAEQREDFLKTVHYEATRAGLDPQLVLGLIQVESGFKKYAVSRAGARGYMQVMPFWARQIGSAEHNLFHLRTNLRYGCTILRHYLDIEHGNLFRALGRYNGSLGKPDYPRLVDGALRKTWTNASKAQPPQRRLAETTQQPLTAPVRISAQ